MSALVFTFFSSPRRELFQLPPHSEPFLKVASFQPFLTDTSILRIYYSMPVKINCYFGPTELEFTAREPLSDTMTPIKNYTLDDFNRRFFEPLWRTLLKRPKSLDPDSSLW